MASSVIESYGYDTDDRRLTVRFASGRTYSYEAVPAEIAAGFAAASSKGRYFNDRVRDRYPFERSRASQAE